MACAGPAASPPSVLLISLDGFRADYLDRPAAVTLRSLAARGVRGRLVPVFPSKTFPNHYTIVTGLRPERHGLIANTMWDPDREAWYRLSDRDAVGDSTWYGGEPLWVAAERAGRRTAPLFWPGSEAPIGGVRPSYWRPFEFDDRPAALVDEVLGVYDSAPGDVPAFVALYFHVTDTEGHTFGIGAPEVDSAIAVVDRAMARLVAGLAERGLGETVDLIVVSDHGMADTRPDQVVFLEELIDLDRVTVSDWNPVVHLWPDAGAEEEVYRQLQAHPHVTAFRKADGPNRFHYRKNRRIAPVIGVADEGWSITTRSYFADDPERFGGANHGYDPALPSMHAVFVASGPSFREGVDAGRVSNIHLYELMAAILDLVPAPNDGSLDSVAPLLRGRVTGPH